MPRVQWVILGNVTHVAHAVDAIPKFAQICQGAGPGLPMPMSLREAVSFPYKADHFPEEVIIQVLQRVGLATAALVTWLRRKHGMSGIKSPG